MRQSVLLKEEETAESGCVNAHIAAREDAVPTGCVDPIISARREGGDRAGSGHAA